MMAGDGGRVPDVSEQRAEPHDAGIEAAMRAVYDRWPQVNAETRAARPYEAVYGSAPLDNAEDRAEMEVAIAAYLAHADPASVLAALLAESPEATVSAIEALLTSEEAVEAGAQAAYYDRYPDGTWSVASGRVRATWCGNVEAAILGACRSLLSKAPKGDGDA